jgi:S-adenosyl-L-methionine hydrolase (adenosine-forming)
MQSACGLLTLLTDFGLTEPFVGVMKGVVCSAHPSVRIIDITHGIRPGSVVEGAFWLERSYRYFPAGSVHCAVVDPGVGSSRAAVAMAADRHFFVGPDNGLLAEVTLRAPHAEVRAIESERLGLRDVSATFHGRDLFAVIAARLAARELSFEDVGPLVHLSVPSPIPGVVSEADHFVGNVLTADRFGNLITSLRASEVLPATGTPFRVQVAGQWLRSVRTFADAEPGELVALVGSFDAVEIAVRDGNALSRLAPVPGANVKLFPS